MHIIKKKQREYRNFMGSWNGWYHVSSNTYGAWLPGDPRGWRTKQHKRHVPGDYRDPPPNGFGDYLLNHAAASMKQDAVKLSKQERQTARQAILDMLRAQDVETIAFALDTIHFHVLAKFADTQVRPRVGRAKKHARFVLKGYGQKGKVWERGSHVVPIQDRSHQLNVFHYIERHRHKGAWAWTFREGFYWGNTIQRKP